MDFGGVFGYEKFGSLVVFFDLLFGIPDGVDHFLAQRRGDDSLKFECFMQLLVGSCRAVSIRV